MSERSYRRATSHSCCDPSHHELHLAPSVRSATRLLYRSGYIRLLYRSGYTRLLYRSGYTRLLYRNGYTRLLYRSGYIRLLYRSGYTRLLCRSGYTRLMCRSSYTRLLYKPVTDDPHSDGVGDVVLGPGLHATDVRPLVRHLHVLDLQAPRRGRRLLQAVLVGVLAAHVRADGHQVLGPTRVRHLCKPFHL